MSQRQRMRERQLADVQDGAPTAPSSARSLSAIELYIERLTVEGLAQRDLAAFGGAVQGELERLLADDQTLSAITLDHELGLVAGESPASTLGERPQDLGQQVAGAVYRSLSGASWREGGARVATRAGSNRGRTP